MHSVRERFCRDRKPYECVASFASPYRPSHLPPHPNWIADGVAWKKGASNHYVQYLSPKGLQNFLQRVRICPLPCCHCANPAAKQGFTTLTASVLSDQRTFSLLCDQCTF